MRLRGLIFTLHAGTWLIFLYLSGPFGSQGYLGKYSTLGKKAPFGRFLPIPGILFPEIFVLGSFFFPRPEPAEPAGKEKSSPLDFPPQARFPELFDS